MSGRYDILFADPVLDYLTFRETDPGFLSQMPFCCCSQSKIPIQSPSQMSFPRPFLNLSKPGLHSLPCLILLPIKPHPYQILPRKSFTVPSSALMKHTIYQIILQWPIHLATVQMALIPTLSQLTKHHSSTCLESLLENGQKGESFGIDGTDRFGA